jgi:hypothetical protein
MKMKQAWGWLLAGVVAAGLNASYHDGRLEWAHQAVEQAEHNTRAVLALASGHADEFLTETRLLTAGDETAPLQPASVAQGKLCRWANALARVQTRFAQRTTARTDREFARIEEMSAREEAALARVEANRARIDAEAARFRVPAVAFSSVSFKTPVVCPRVHVNIPRPPMIKMPEIPEIHIETSGTGPI